MIANQSVALKVILGIVEDDMGVSTSVAEGIDRDAPQAPGRPRFALDWDLCVYRLRLIKNVHFKLHVYSEGAATAHTSIPQSFASISGFIVSKRAVGGTIPLSSAIMDLTIPAAPLAPSRWPMFDFTDPLLIRGQRESQEKTASSNTRTHREEQKMAYVL